jgi:hypothetical protein
VRRVGVVMSDYRPHPAAEMFPLMSGVELAELAEDIKAHGLVDPIVLLGGLILDGRNRLAACGIAGVEPRFTTIEDVESPTLYVISKNLHRRHLTTSQRAAIAAEIMPMLRAEAKERQAEGGRHGGAIAGQGRPKSDRVLMESPEAYSPSESKGNTRDIAGKAVGVAGCTVQRAATVKDADPEEFERVKRGEITVEAAYRKVTQSTTPEPDKAPVISIVPNRRQQMIENAAKRRMVEGLSQIRGLCRGLSEVNAAIAARGCDRCEIKEWISISQDSAKQLRVFASELAKYQESISETA